MENTNNSSFSRLMSVLFIAMGIFLGIYAFFANATSPDINGNTWDNSDYLNSTFWSYGPSSGDIIAALYGTGGSGSVYTQNWNGYNSGSCLSGVMNVEYISAGTSTIPLNLSGNTIYVLSSGNYITTGTINFSGCTAIVGTGDVTLYSTGQLLDILSISWKQNTIVDNIAVNGSGDGSGGSHTSNYYGVEYYSSNKNTINNAQVYNNLWNGILMKYSSNNGLNNIQAYNNINYGIDLYTTSSNNLLNNIQAYNNAGGVLIQNSSTNNSINNIQAYNNSNHGIFLGSSNNAINNIQAYNNLSYGIYLFNSSNNLLNNIQVYNNNIGIYLNPAAIGNKYYGTGYFFANTSDIGGTPGNLTGGTGTYYSTLGRTTGQLITGGTMSWNYITNPKDSSGNYLLNWNTAFSGITGYQAWSGIVPILYSFGGMISKQQQPVLYSGSMLITGGLYDATKFTASQIRYISGTITINNGDYTNTSGITVYISATEPVEYRIFGDIVAEKTGLITTNLTTGLVLSGNDGIKNIFVQFSTGSDWTTHYQTTITLDTTAPTLSGVLPNEYYTGDLTITGYDNIAFSGFQLSGTFYTGSSLMVTGDGVRVLTGYDNAGNTTGITFTIDKIAPTLAGVASGGYYNTGVTITGYDNIVFYRFQLSGTFHAGSSLTVTGEGVRVLTGYDKAGNSTGVTFTIDKTFPIFTGTTLSLNPVFSGGYFNTGIQITFYDFNFSGAVLSGLDGNTYLNTGYASGTIITGEGTYKFTVYDTAGNSTGMIFTIDTTNPVVTGNYPTTGLNITGGNDINFTRSGSDTNISGYTLYIDSTGYNLTNINNYTVTLANGSYTWHVVATDRAGNTGGSAALPFMITTPLSGTVTITGTNIQYVGSNAYAKDYAGLYLRPNQPCTYIVTGDIVSIISGSTMGALYVYPYLTGTDGAKNIYITFSNTSGETVSKTISIYFDTTAPIPTLTNPGSGATATGAFNLTWSAVIDGGIGLSGYQYFVSNTSGTVVKSGFTTSTSTGVANNELGTSGTFYWYVRSIDKLGNVGTSAIQSFNYTGFVDTVPDSFSFNHITSAILDRVYGSNTVTITGLSANTPVLASVNRGALYISGNMVGTTGYIQNGWTVKIELTSSDEYDDDVTSTLTIGGVSATFRITTETEEESNNTDYEDIETNLSNTEKLMIIAIFETLRDLYAGDKEEEFFNTLMVMLENKMDDFDEGDDEYDALKYLYDLADQYYNAGDFGNNITTTPWIINGVYTAPNGKRYIITYDSSKQRFTSTNFVVPKYFPTLDTLKYIIDINNPLGSQYANAKPILARWKNASIDGTRQTSPYTAPNRKVFYFFKNIEGQYSSYTFTVERYFDNLEAVKEFIYNSNR